MSDALEERTGKVSRGGRTITYLRFADAIGVLAKEEKELNALAESLDEICTRYKMLIRAEKTFDKQRQWHAEGDQGKRTQVSKSYKLQVLIHCIPWSNCFRWRLETGGCFSNVAHATAALTKLTPA